MSDWTDRQTIEIAKRVLADEGASADRRMWAAATLSAAEHIGEPLTEEQARSWRAVINNKLDAKTHGDA